MKARGKAMPSVTKLLHIIGSWTAIMAILLSASYCSELPKYRFEKVAMETTKDMPGSRLISSMKTGDIVSPVSWVWPATTTWNFALPDRQSQGRFYIYSLRYGEPQATILLLDAFCERREAVWYDLDEPDDAFPARDLFGGPVVAPNGKTYRRLKSQPPLPPEWTHELCETDWTAERKAAGG
jgi:hypothetical protein